MNQVAVFELQGVMSFGVAAHMSEQVRLRLLPRHRWVILDAGRVPAWDSTALAQLRALLRDLEKQGIAAAVAALDELTAASAACALLSILTAPGMGRGGQLARPDGPRPRGGSDPWARLASMHRQARLALEACCCPWRLPRRAWYSTQVTAIGICWWLSRAISL
jgi:SulP family sulfate permease